MAVSTGSSIRSEPNVVPMIDVLLVLLIIFMIVIPQVSSGFTAVPPEGANLKPHPEEDTDQVLGIDRSGQYYLNRDAIPNDQLGARLRAIYGQERDDYIMYVKADKNLDYNRVLAALDTAAAAGVRVTGLITEQQAGTESVVEQPAGGQ
ncbi:MAG TPA: biopolymer transporter ExbD [Gemmatimonadales bacterium]